MKIKKLEAGVDTWFYGLKEAEEIMSDGFVPDYNDFTSNFIWFVKRGTMIGIPLKNENRISGVLDYIKYRDKVLNPINGSE